MRGTISPLTALFAGWVIPAVASGMWLPPTFAVAQAPAGNVRIEIGVDPASVAIGEPFRSAVRVVAPEGSRAEIGSFTPGDSLDVAGPPAFGSDEAAADGSVAAAVFSLVAWYPGAQIPATVPVRITEAGGTVRTFSVTLRLPEVRSILPDSGDSIAPRPPRGLAAMPVPATFPAWWWLLMLIGALGALVFGYRLLARSQEISGDVAPVDARTWALAQLGDDGAGSILAGGNPRLLVERVSWVVRAYLARTSPRLGQDLTTSEVLGLLADDTAGQEVVGSLNELLRAADRVKFAGYRPSLAEAGQMLEDARAWVAAYPDAQSDSTPARAA